MNRSTPGRSRALSYKTAGIQWCQCGRYAHSGSHIPFSRRPMCFALVAVPQAICAASISSLRISGMYPCVALLVKIWTCPSSSRLANSPGMSRPIRANCSFFCSCQSIHCCARYSLCFSPLAANSALSAAAFSIRPSRYSTNPALNRGCASCSSSTGVKPMVSAGRFPISATPPIMSKSGRYVSAAASNSHASPWG